MIKDDIADQLVFATTRIIGTDGKSTWSGTGFFMLKETETGSKIAIVTNKHVIKDATEVTVNFVKANDDGTPNNKEHFGLKINDIQSNCKYHPEDDIDVCLIPVDAIFNGLAKAGCNIYYKCIPTTMIVTPDGLETLTPIEDVIMIGYPNAIMDNENLKPIVRSGITATDLKNNYNGKPEFMIDMACFPGSSGSPVFLRKQGLAKEKTDEGLTLAIKPSYAFLGILHAGPTISVDGQIVIKDIPTKAVPYAEINTMMNLGYVIRAEKVLEMF